MRSKTRDFAPNAETSSIRNQRWFDEIDRPWNKAVESRDLLSGSQT
jgi:hypothetical protein